jgi:sugar lactone lactonase YvrE
MIQRWTFSRIALAVVMLTGALGILGGQASGALTPNTEDTGFSLPEAGTPRFEYLAPPKSVDPDQINRPIGQALADEIATGMGFSKNDALTNQQYLEFVTGGGVGGRQDRAVLLGQSVNLFINNVGFPLYSTVDGQITTTVLASFGLIVDPGGRLQSLANESSPSKQVNVDLQPGPDGYMGPWCRDNGCQSTITQLYLSAYFGEVILGNEAQQNAFPVQLVKNTKDGSTTYVGMSMSPSIWLVNFILLYALNPKFGALMPSLWTPIPDEIATALLASASNEVPETRGQIDFRQYASLLPSYQQLLRVVAGDKPAASAALSQPGSSAVDAAGNVYIADTGNNVIKKVTPAGESSVIAGGGATPPGATTTATSAQLSAPHGIAVDAAGNVYIADTGNNLVEKVTPAGELSVIAGGGATVPNNSSPSTLATSAALSAPRGVAVDGDGNVYVADTGNNLVEVIDIGSGNIYVLAGGGSTTPQAIQAATDWETHFGLGSNARLDGPQGVAVDASGIVYIADTGNNVIARVASAIFGVVAGGGTLPAQLQGQATDSRLNAPQGIAVSPTGVLYITDSGNNLVERIDYVVKPADVVVPAIARPSFTG